MANATVAEVGEKKAKLAACSYGRDERNGCRPVVADGPTETEHSTGFPCVINENVCHACVE